MATDAMALIRSTFLHAFFLQARGVVVRSPGTRHLVQSGAEAVVLATGVTPRALSIEGADHPKVVSYVDVLKRSVPVGPGFSKIMK